MQAAEQEHDLPGSSSFLRAPQTKWDNCSCKLVPTQLTVIPTRMMLDTYLPIVKLFFARYDDVDANANNRKRRHGLDSPQQSDQFP
mmetsp:Transcript_6965/g.10644  ORF Transcript_6965/g.10644 Transcript_6965/m.10644 type:complete len:86 (-) Transcript_6965:52-309(-)